MTLLAQRLYIKEFLKLLLLLTVGLSLFFSIIGLIDRLNDFMPHNPSFILMVRYTLLNLPRNIHFLLPMAILLSGIFTFSQAVNRREIITIKASGGKIKGFLRPFVWTGFILTLCAFMLGEVIIPAASKAIRSTEQEIMGKGNDVSFKEGVLYMRGKEGDIVRISLYIPGEQKARGVSILSFGPDGLRQKTEARSARWTGEGWKLSEVTVYDVTKGATRSVKEMGYSGINSPGILQADLWKVEEMTMPEVLRYQKRINQAGVKNSRLTVDISSRVSYPVVNLFMLLLGIALSLESRVIEEKLGRFFPSQRGAGKKTGGIISAGLGLLISVAYFFGYSLFLSLGYAGTLPPLIAPWIIPALFGAVSFYLYWHIPE